MFARARKFARDFWAVKGTRPWLILCLALFAFAWWHPILNQFAVLSLVAAGITFQRAAIRSVRADLAKMRALNDEMERLGKERAENLASFIKFCKEHPGGQITLTTHEIDEKKWKN